MTDSNLSSEISLERPSFCLEFAEYEEIAVDIVDDILNKAKIVIAQKYEKNVIDNTTRTSMVGNIQWPSIEEFDCKSAPNKINDFIYYTANLDMQWMYAIKNLHPYHDKISDFFEYEVIFSVPSKTYPVPQVTASVFFTIEVSRINPPDCPVRVTYRLEGSSHVLHPGKDVINSAMLIRIMNSKLANFQRYCW